MSDFPNDDESEKRKEKKKNADLPEELQSSYLEIKQNSNKRSKF